MRKFNIQDRIVLDEMVDTFTAEMNKNHDAGGHDATGLKRSSYDKQVFDIISSLD